MLSLLILWALSSSALFIQNSQPTAGQRVGTGTYEDDEVKIVIPVGWTRVVRKYPGELVLQKDGYTLRLVFKAGHASPFPGGRFIEAFTIPWVPPGNTEDCIVKFVPQPASRTLLFENVVLDTADEHVREVCGIAKELGGWTGVGTIDPRRWFAGYFTSGANGFYFDESDPRSGCFGKLYTLTSSAQKPEQLPIVGDPHLQHIVQESIDIVNSIYYKRCAPKLSEPFHLAGPPN